MVVQWCPCSRAKTSAKQLYYTGERPHIRLTWRIVRGDSSARPSPQSEVARWRVALHRRAGSSLSDTFGSSCMGSSGRNDEHTEHTERDSIPEAQNPPVEPGVRPIHRWGFS